MPMPVFRRVLIPQCPQHEGIHFVRVTLEWVCPVCGGPRGEPRPVISYDGSYHGHCDGWTNPCGHVDLYEDCIQEARGAST